MKCVFLLENSYEMTLQEASSGENGDTSESPQVKNLRYRPEIPKVGCLFGDLISLIFVFVFCFFCFWWGGRKGAPSRRVAFVSFGGVLAAGFSLSGALWSFKKPRQRR